MIETIIVTGIVVAVAVTAGRSFYQTMMGKTGGYCCGCAKRTCDHILKKDAQS
ncbi:MAG: FeoB-associated Cys-rich membrane protein [Syntrophales bacterium]|jgi:hypothetical protein|nr:FeoB-associated Cys-rich membrane protein [Syntrophales bacterium]